jgi:hypothetical protein
MLAIPICRTELQDWHHLIYLFLLATKNQSVDFHLVDEATHVPTYVCLFIRVELLWFIFSSSQPRYCASFSVLYTRYFAFFWRNAVCLSVLHLIATVVLTCWAEKVIAPDLSLILAPSGSCDRSNALSMSTINQLRHACCWLSHVNIHCFHLTIIVNIASSQLSSKTFV